MLAGSDMPAAAVRASALRLALHEVGHKSL